MKSKRKGQFPWCLSACQKKQACFLRELPWPGIISLLVKPRFPRSVRPRREVNPSKIQRPDTLPNPSAFPFLLILANSPPTHNHPLNQVPIKFIEMWQQQNREMQGFRDFQAQLGEKGSWVTLARTCWRQPEPAQEKYPKWQVYRKYVIKDCISLQKYTATEMQSLRQNF